MMMRQQKTDDVVHLYRERITCPIHVIYLRIVYSYYDTTSISCYRLDLQGIDIHSNSYQLLCVNWIL